MKIKLNEESLEKLIIDMREESKKLNQTIRDLDLLEATLKGQEQESKWNLKIFTINADLWRSLNSSKTLERKLYENLS